MKAIQTLSRFGTGGLLVMQDSETIGVIGERDVREFLHHNGGAALHNALVQDVMSPDERVGSEQWPLERCLKIMMETSPSDHLPIVGMGGVINAMLSMPQICSALTDTVIEGVQPAEPSTLADVLEQTMQKRLRARKPEDKLLQPRSERWISQVTADASVAAAVARMSQDRTASVVVASPTPRSVPGGCVALGLFTESTLLKCLASSGSNNFDESLAAALVSEHMTPAADLIRLDAQCPAFDALRIIAQSGCSHLVIGNETGEPSEILGVVSRGALLRYVVQNA